jgi:Zn finger protein HypA/HybF involved in hydrogenase expression
MMPLNSLKTIYYITGVDLGKIINQYSYKVNVPCENCHSLIRLGIDEKISFCPVCHSPWNGNGKSEKK